MAVSRLPAPAVTVDPLEILEWVDGPPVPDPITFVISEDWLDRPNLYPRQATLLKIIFLRTDLMTEYDHMVIAEWIQLFKDTNPDWESGENKFSAKTKGLPPDIYERMEYLKERGYKWFKEVLLAIGRRGSKGFVCALAMAYVIWHYLSLGNPQDHYGIDRDKALAAMIFAGKKDQAKQNLFGDIYNVVTGAPCFTRYISEARPEMLSLYVPNDFIRMHKMAARGILSTRDAASIQIVPRESTLLAARGPAGFCVGFDEAAHVTNTGTTREFGQVYNCLDGDTRVLTADLDWKRIKDVVPGDLLVGFDERPPGAGKQRKLREAKVLGTSVSRSAPLRLTFEDGTSVVCSKNHRWFRIDGDKFKTGRWVQAGGVRLPGQSGINMQLNVGDPIRFIADPWEVDNTRDGGYLAGIYDGEGHMLQPGDNHAYQISFSQKKGIVLERALEILRDREFSPSIVDSREDDVCYVNINGLADVMRVVGSFRPSRFYQRRNEIWENRTPHSSGAKWKIISKIEELPEQDLIDIETSTATFIAEGFISHNSATPSLDQFGRDGFICLPSSTWQMIGRYYELWELALSVEDKGGGLVPIFPNKLVIQLESWAPYEDWQKASFLPLFPPGYQGDLGEYADGELPVLQPLKGAIQAFDEEMEKEELANPETFAVERRSDWATVLDAYLNQVKVAEMFRPWDARPERYGPPQLTMQTSGPLIVSYKAHGDPSSVNKRFGFAIAHEEADADGLLHCVFDLIHFWDPAEFEGHTIDYDIVIDWIFDEIVKKFLPEELTFDQFNSVASVQRLQKKVRHARLPKNVQVFEKTATGPLNWKRFETFKAALNMGFVHAPPHAEAQQELSFLQLMTGNKVEHPTSGPVQTKDIADCIVECTHVILGEQMNNYIARDLRNQRPGMSIPGGVDAYSRFDPGREANPFAAALGAGAPAGMMARGIHPGTPRMPGSGRTRSRKPYRS